MSALKKIKQLNLSPGGQVEFLLIAEHVVPVSYRDCLLMQEDIDALGELMPDEEDTSGC